ncbi:MAG: hypothetical protein ABI425_02860 [Patescibacteria group bacterium]
MDHPEIFGQRIAGIISINNFLANDSKQVLGENITKDENKKPFVVAVFGDSYVFGAGVRNEQVFPLLLEKKLNRIRPTKVLSFALSGDTIFDNYEKYKIIQEMGVQPNVVVFGLVNNDLLLSPLKWAPSPTIYTRFSVESSNIFNGCTGEIIRQEDGDSYERDVSAPFEVDTLNYCGFLKTLTLLPKEKAIYFNFWDVNLEPDTRMEKLIAGLSSKGLHIVTPLKEFKKYLGNNNDKISEVPAFHVSKLDFHPSAVSHELFAESLFQEITSNTDYQFMQIKQN